MTRKRTQGAFDPRTFDPRDPQALAALQQETARIPQYTPSGRLYDEQEARAVFARWFHSDDGQFIFDVLRMKVGLRKLANRERMDDGGLYKAAQYELLEFIEAMRRVPRNG
jgi:hypothetical protein